MHDEAAAPDVGPIGRRVGAGVAGRPGGVTAARGAVDPLGAGPRRQLATARLTRPGSGGGGHRTTPDDRDARRKALAVAVECRKDARRPLLEPVCLKEPLATWRRRRMPRREPRGRRARGSRGPRSPSPKRLRALRSTTSACHRERSGHENDEVHVDHRREAECGCQSERDRGAPTLVVDGEVSICDGACDRQDCRTAAADDESSETDETMGGSWPAHRCRRDDANPPRPVIGAAVVVVGGWWPSPGSRCPLVSRRCRLVCRTGRLCRTPPDGPGRPDPRGGRVQERGAPRSPSVSMSRRGGRAPLTRRLQGPGSYVFANGLSRASSCRRRAGVQGAARTLRGPVPGRPPLGCPVFRRSSAGGAEASGSEPTFKPLTTNSQDAP